jgi:HEAT repeat protein
VPKPAAIPALVAALADKSKRDGASADLVAAGKDAVGEVVKALDHPDVYVRLAAIHVLADIGEAAKDAIPRLTVKAKEDTSAAVRGAAKKAIDKIQGK